MGWFLYAFAADQNYGFSDRVQCKVPIFTPCKCDEVVSPVGKEIMVTPTVQCGGADLEDVDPTGLLRRKLVGQLA